MKLFFKTLMLITLFTHAIEAREIVLIDNQSSQSDGEFLKNLLITKFKLPAELITLNNISRKCHFNNEAIVYLCLDKEGQLQIGKMNHYVVRNSLGIFLNDVDWGQE